MVMPPGLSATQWKAAQQEFRSAIGEDGLLLSDEDTVLYRDAYSAWWGEAEEKLVAAALVPRTLEQVQALVRVAAKHKIPLFPISTGKNLGYGGSAPNLSGSLVVDLKRMNRVIEVDDKRHFAIVEPGVSYFDLYAHIRANALNVWIDCPDPGWGSVVGNALDHGVGHTQGVYRDHFLSHAGMEVVLPNGEVMRTGMGAMPGAETFADFRYGYGPYVDGLFGQAGFGIVTKMGFHLMPPPEVALTRRVTALRTNDIVPLVEIFNELEHLNLIGMPIYESPMFEHQFTDPTLIKLAQAADWHDGKALDAYAVSNNISRWSVTFALYGPMETVEATWRWAKAKFTAAIPGARFDEVETLRFPLDDSQVEAIKHKVIVGVPNMNIFQLGARSAFNPHPFDGHLLFSPIIPKTGQAVLKAQRVFGDGMREMGVVTPYSYGPFTVPATWIPRAFAFTNGFPVSRSDPKVNKRSRETMRKLIDLGAQNGWGEYRATPLFQEQVMGTYSFNNNILRRFCEKLKDAVDPDGIMAPGRGGFWPTRFREGRS